MPVFTLEGPNGERVKIDAPDRETALHGAQVYGQSGGKVRSGASPSQQAIFQPWNDIKAAVSGAADRVGSDFQQSVDRASAPRTLGQSVIDAALGPVRAGKAIADVGGLVLSPMQGAADAFAVRPVARALTRVPGGVFPDADENAQAINTAMMGARAVPGAKFGLFGGKSPIARQAAADVRVGQALNRAMSRDMTQPADVVSAARTNAPAPVFHSGGQNLRSMAEVLAKSPGAGENLIPEATSKYQAGATDRISDQIANGLGGRNDYFATVDGVNEARQQQVAPVFERAYATPIPIDTFQNRFAPILERLPRGTLEQAYDIARKEGRNPNDVGFVSSQNTRRVPGGGSVDAPSTVRISNPTMETLHYVKKGIDQTLEQYRNDVTGELDLAGSPAAQADSRVRALLGRTMRDVNPHYDQAMQIWGDDADRLAALSLGRNVFSPKFDMQAERLGGQVGEMSDASRDMFRKGVGEAVLAQVRNKGGVPAARQLLRGREFGDRIRLAFPHQQAFDDFMGSLDHEVTLQNQSNRITGGSPTYPLQAARADLEAQGADPIDFSANVAEAVIDPSKIPRQAAKAALKAIPRRDRSIIGDQRLNEVASQALTDPDAFDRVVNAPRLDREARAARARSVADAARLLLPAALVVDRQRHR